MRKGFAFPGRNDPIALILTAPENLKAIEAIRTRNLALADPRVTTSNQAAEVAARPHGTVTREDGVLKIVPAAGLGPVITAVEATGVRIVRIESREANLETAFLALTGRGLRDVA